MQVLLKLHFPRHWSLIFKTSSILTTKFSTSLIAFMKIYRVMTFVSFPSTSFGIILFLLLNWLLFWFSCHKNWTLIFISLFLKSFVTSFLLYLSGVRSAYWKTFQILGYIINCWWLFARSFHIKFKEHMYFWQFLKHFQNIMDIRY